MTSIVSPCKPVEFSTQQNHSANENVAQYPTDSKTTSWSENGDF